MRDLSGLNLAELFIVSQVTVESETPSDAKAGANMPTVAVKVEEAQGVKCPRCWMHTASTHPDGLCPRCAAVIEAML